MSVVRARITPRLVLFACLAISIVISAGLLIAAGKPKSLGFAGAPSVISSPSTPTVSNPLKITLLPPSDPPTTVPETP